MKYSVIVSQYKQLDYLIRNKEFWERQTFKDFEIIVASDEDDPTVLQWLEKNVDKYVYQNNEGYRLSKILNKAVTVAEGQYLVFVMGDSYPKEDFLEQLNFGMKPERVVNGIRLNVDQGGSIISSDWRIEHFGQEMGNEQKILLPEPWRAMTLNGQAMSRALYEKIGGMCEEYVMYGREDWDLNMRAFHDGAEMWWINTAIIYHRDHTPQDDSQTNIELFEKRKEALFKDRTAQKEAMIRDPKRAEQKFAEQQERAKELEKTEAYGMSAVFKDGQWTHVPIGGYEE